MAPTGASPSERLFSSTEKRVVAEFKDRAAQGIAGNLWTKTHSRFFVEHLLDLPATYLSLDSSRPWLVFWIVHALYCLKRGDSLPGAIRSHIVETMIRFQHEGGGYAGNVGMLPHMATTYAGIACLMELAGGDERVLSSIDRPRVYSYLWRMKRPEGNFMVHEGGESDVRACYTALASAVMLNVLTPELREHCAEWLLSLQTYEGGFGGEPGDEAHGGYTFCGAAALAILGKLELADVARLAAWAAQRQCRESGGFQGRSNKLVDACYSFWVGALFPLLEMELGRDRLEQQQQQQGDAAAAAATPAGTRFTFDREKMTQFLLDASQQPDGGFVDKPGKFPDLYHCAYGISGLSLCGHPDLAETNCVLNIVSERLAPSLAYFADRPTSHAELLRAPSAVVVSAEQSLQSSNA